MGVYNSEHDLTLFGGPCLNLYTANCHGRLLVKVPILGEQCGSGVTNTADYLDSSDSNINFYI